MVNPTDTAYDHPDVIDQVTSEPHKSSTSIGYYCDLLLYNPTFSSKALYEACKFIYLIRPARARRSIRCSKPAGYSPGSAYPLLQLSLAPNLRDGPFDARRCLADVEQLA
jgi:hypothetical protein